MTAAEITAGQNSFNSEKRPLSEVDEAVIISIQNSSGGLTTRSVAIRCFRDSISRRGCHRGFCAGRRG